ncbi:hypothetical protein ANN_12420 [Periplaneta americana]|uniref:Uncharacterized protein n=1 Tax=Periplaneta americana TaxID=6978 RepID=A0ABQ8TGQ9_PERAM|nr:hypothetical protein ANN_12420 [Periplaneta americana]
MKEIEMRHQGRWDEVMMTDYCWSMKRDNVELQHRRQSRRQKLLKRKRRVRTVGRGPHRKPAGEVAVRPGGVLPHAVPQPAHALRQAAAAPAVAADRELAGHRTALLRAPGGQDAHRDAHQGHAAQRQQLQLALHELDVTQRLAATRVRVKNQFLRRAGGGPPHLLLMGFTAEDSGGDPRQSHRMLPGLEAPKTIITLHWATRPQGLVLPEPLELRGREQDIARGRLVGTQAHRTMSTTGRSSLSQFACSIFHEGTSYSIPEYLPPVTGCRSRRLCSYIIFYGFLVSAGDSTGLDSLVRRDGVAMGERPARLVTRPHLERVLTDGGPGTRHFVSTQFLATGFEPEHLSDGVPSSNLMTDACKLRSSGCRTLEMCMDVLGRSRSLIWFNDTVPTNLARAQTMELADLLDGSQTSPHYARYAPGVPRLTPQESSKILRRAASRRGYNSVTQCRCDSSKCGL